VKLGALGKKCWFVNLGRVVLVAGATIEVNHWIPTVRILPIFHLKTVSVHRIDIVATAARGFCQHLLRPDRLHAGAAEVFSASGTYFGAVI
jgi:hypothetical protein